MSLDLLEKNWEDIRRRVIAPLWKSAYKSMYESLKLDYDDFESMASYELTKAMVTYDESKSNIFTFASNVIKHKAKTELRDFNRDKRRALCRASSINCLISEGSDEEISSTLKDESISQNEYNELTEVRIGSFINSLSNQQLRLLILKLLEFDTDDIPDMLNISRKTMNDILKGLKSSDLTDILRRRKF